MLEGAMLEKSYAYLRGMIARLSSLNHYIRQQPGFVKKTGRGVYTPKQACTVEDSLRFIVVDVKSRVLQMQAEIGDTIYKDDAKVRANLQELLDGIEQGLVYFEAAQDNREEGIILHTRVPSAVCRRVL